MAFVNNVMIIRRDLLTRLSELYKEDSLYEMVDRIPLEISQRIKNNERCCKHKTRAVVKYKIMAIMGFGLEDEVDELDTLRHYAQLVMAKKKNTEHILSVVHEACDACVKANYIVTNLCKGCVAQPCINNCPKNAVGRTATGQAVINSSACINCGICKNLCPYHSIVYVPIPCEESCPVGAIKKNSDGLEEIDFKKCILCGKCVNSCPFGSIMEATEIFQVMPLLKAHQPIKAIIAPAIFGQFKTKPGAIIKALRKLGFSDVIEVASGARETTLHEAAELKHKIEEGQPFMTTSCCPAWVAAVDKHLPEMKPYVSETPTPMGFTARRCKEKDPNVPVVFIGPCIAKRREGLLDPNVDYVMTFEELGCLMNGWGVGLSEGEDDEIDANIDLPSRRYCLSGGVANAVNLELGSSFVTKAVNGFDKKQLKILSVYAKTKKTDGSQMIEVMSCEGGCIAGPSSYEFPKDAQKNFPWNM